jgi:hypothetical protein
VEARGVNHLWPLEQTADVGPGTLERGDRAIGSSRDYATRVALLALVLDQQEQAVFQRLREWYLDAKHKSGKSGENWM